MGVNIKSLIKKLTWQDYLLILILVIFSVTLSNLYSEFKQMPSPIYGGDLYHQLGAIHHVNDGGDAFKSYTTDGELPSYFPMYTFVVGNFAKTFNVEPINAIFITSIIFLVLGMLMTYILFLLITKDKLLALCSVVMYFPMSRGILKYTEFTTMFVYPMFFLFLVAMFVTKRKYLYSILAGVAYGIATLSHAMGFFILSLLIPAITLYTIAIQYYDFKKKKLDMKKVKKNFKENTIYMAIMSGIGFVISLIFWRIPLEYMILGKESLSNPNYIYNLSTVSSVAFERLINFNNNFFGIVTILVLVGLILPFLIKNIKKEYKLLYAVAIVLLVMPYHFIITNIAGFTLIPNHMVTHAYQLVRVIAATTGLYMISGMLKKYKTHFAAITFIVLLILSLSAFSEYTENNRWIQLGKRDLEEPYNSISNYIRSNYDVNDVFISTKEVSSAINAITGRKFMSLRFNHISPFDNVIQRDADMAIILYGNDTKVKKELLKEYNVKYLYWDYYWFNSEFRFDNQGRVVGYFDPITVFDTPENREYFDKYGVQYNAEHMAFDPSKRDGSSSIKQFDLLMVYPTNFNITHPWHENLDDMLTLEKEWKMQNQAAARIYKFNMDGE